MRGVGVMAAGSAGAWLALSAAGAQVAQADSLDTAKVAAALAAIIRRDAREQLRASRSAVTVTKRCCGVRVLRVHYDVRASRPLATHSAYVLRLETRRAAVQGVAVFEASSEAPYIGGGRSGESSSLFAFAIHREHRDWRTVISYEQISQGVEELNGHAGGLGFARACALRSTLPRALYGEVLRTLERARHHRAFAPTGLAPANCLAA
jgi:hypothetical protein